MKIKRIQTDKGFTLVELIVVLVILAILAAILVPALLGYIDRAKESQNLFKARNMLSATQAVLVDYYGKDASLPGEDAATNANSEFSKQVRKIADDDPYMVIVGVGTDPEKKPGYGESKHDQYTVYFVAYWEAQDIAPLFFDGTDWSMDYPWGDKGGRDYNYFNAKGKRINLSFIFIQNKDKNKGGEWSDLRKAVKQSGHTDSTNDKRIK